MLKTVKNRKTVLLSIFLFFIFLSTNANATSYNESLDALVSSLASRASSTTVHTIAVTGFADAMTNQRFMFSEILEDDLTTKLVQTNKFHVVVKSKINEVLKELKFGYEGFVDPEKRKQFGKLAQADAILTGTYRQQSNDVIINAQLINIETGEAIWAGSISISMGEVPPGAFQFPNIYQETPTIVAGEKEGAAAPIKTGIISITSQPSDALIYIDAKLMGKTPAILQGVTVGNRTITIVKDEYETYVTNVNIETNKTTSIRAILSHQTGSLKINTKPSGADIYIDGYKRGTSPLTIMLITGTHKIKAKLENYQAYEKDVTIGYKEQKSEDIQLTEEPGSLLVKVHPSPAEVYIDQESKGEASPILSLQDFPSGEHTLVIKKDGYEDHKEKFEIHAHQSKTIDVVLEKQPETPAKKIDVLSIIFPSVFSIDTFYNNLTPLNKTFNNEIGNISGLYAGVNLSIFYMGWDYWDALGSLKIPGAGDICGSAFNIGVLYPLAFNLSNSVSLIVYGSYGGRFENIELKGRDPSTSNTYDITFGNNATIVSGGIKIIFPWQFSVSIDITNPKAPLFITSPRDANSTDIRSGFGIDLSYAQTNSATYTNYQMFRIGVVYGWL